MFKFPTWRPQTFVLVLACHANPETSNKWRTISPCHCKFERVALWGSSETFGQLRELGNWAIRCFLGLRALGTSNLEVTMLFLNLFSMKSDLIQGIWMCSGGRKCLRRVFLISHIPLIMHEAATPQTQSQGGRDPEKCSWPSIAIFKYHERWPARFVA